MFVIRNNNDTDIDNGNVYIFLNDVTMPES